MVLSTIAIGYGNIDRADDGVARAVINELRRQQGRRLLEEGDTGLDDLNGESDSIFIPQLVPEILETLAGYRRIVFIDAHVGTEMEELSCLPVSPEYTASSFTHHLTPSAFLAFLKALYQSEPEAYLVSIRGYDFDFTQTLSAKVQALVRPAAEAVLKLMGHVAV